MLIATKDQNLKYCMGILTFTCMKLLYFCLIGGVVIIESKGSMLITTPSQSKGLYHELILLIPLVFIAARTVYMFLMNGVLYAFGIKELIVFFEVSLSKIKINRQTLCGPIRTNVSEIGFHFFKHFLIWSVSSYEIITFHSLT